MPKIRKPTATPLEPHRGLAALDPELAGIFGPPPLLEGESAADFERLYVRCRTAIEPVDAIEEILARDVVDLTWEILRMRRLKAAYTTVISPQGLGQVLSSLGIESDTRKALTVGWARGDAQTRSLVSKTLKEAGIESEAIVAQSFIVHLDEFERINGLIAHVEARRNAMLRELDRHRDAVAKRRLQGPISEIEDAEFEVIGSTDNDDVD